MNNNLTATIIEQVITNALDNYKELLTFEDLEKKYSISKRTASELVKENKLPVVRINKRVFRFKTSDLEQFIEARSVGAL